MVGDGREVHPQALQGLLFPPGAVGVVAVAVVVVDIFVLTTVAAAVAVDVVIVLLNVFLFFVFCFFAKSSGESYFYDMMNLNLCRV